MTKIFLVSIILTVFFSGCKNQESDPDINCNHWIKKANLPSGGLEGAVCFVIDKSLYVTTGQHDVHTKNFWKYDCDSNVWTKLEDFQEGDRLYANAFSINGYGYVGFGVRFQNCNPICGAVYLNDLWRYDPGNNNWTRMSDFPGEGHSNCTCFTIGSKAYFIITSNELTQDFWMYDTNSDSWSKKANCPGNSGSQAIAFSIGFKGYFGIGFDAETGHNFWEYFPDINQWTQKRNFTGKTRRGALSFSLNNLGYVACGVTPESSIPGRTIEYLNDVWTYNPDTDIWSEFEYQYTGSGSIDMVVGVLNERVFMGLGAKQTTAEGYKEYDDFWEFVP